MFGDRVVLGCMFALILALLALLLVAMALVHVAAR
ncbi:hypothetical protein FHS97_000832 [Sphingomonas endophytica]|uniref:Uncharacterized protein n=1 Tax=Sphingomonas endophytica TaxID=869719 RepID=A0ABR6N2B0_9SPHN|nr:hypothetical protein [Sphingomonas endophytica]